MIVRSATGRLGLVVAFGFAAPAMAQNVSPAPSAGILSEACNVGLTDPKHALASYCRGYVSGVVTGWALASTYVNDQSSLPWCLPKNGISMNTATSVFMSWIAAHPEAKDDPSPVAIVVALRELFPCK